MTASSVTGTGLGSSDKPTTKELASFNNGPSIIFAGILSTLDLDEEVPSSPPSSGYTNTFNFPYPLPGGQEAYVVLLTTINGGSVYVSDVDEDGDGNFTGFSFIAESSCEVSRR